MLTTYQLMRRAAKAFKSYEIPKPVRRNYQRQWIASVTQLGPKWKLAVPVQRCTVPGGSSDAADAYGVQNRSTHAPRWS